MEEQKSEKTTWQKLPVELKSHIVSLVPEDNNATTIFKVIQSLSKAAQLSKELRSLAKDLINNPESVENLAKKYVEENPEKAEQDFIIAAVKGNIKVLEALIIGGININTKANCGLRFGIGRCGRTALMHAIVQGQTEAAKFLLNAGCNIDEQDDCGATALMIAVCHINNNNKEIVNILLNKGADTSLIGQLCETPFIEMTALNFAKALRNKPMIELLTKFTNN